MNIYINVREQYISVDNKNLITSSTREICEKLDYKDYYLQ